MKIKTISVQMKDNSTVGDADNPGPHDYTVTKIWRDEPTTPNEVVNANPQSTEIYKGSDRQAALTAKQAAEREMFTV